MSVERDAGFIEELSKVYAAHDTQSFGVLDFLSAFGSPVDALMYLRLFWPVVIEYQGMYVREESLEDDEDRRRVLEALTQNSGDLTKTEKAINLIEFPSDVFGRRSGESSDALDEYLSHQIIDMWSRRLASLYPGLEFAVEAVPAQATGGEMGVVFYRKRVTSSD